MSVVANVAINVDASKAVNELGRVNKATNDLNQGFSALKAAVAALGAGLAIKAISDVGNQSQKSKIQLQALTAQYGDLEQASASVNRIQKVLGISALDAREGYAQLYASLRGTGVSAQQLEVLFVGLTKAARLSGAGAAEAQGALLQLKQAFASGTLSGDELRSVLETMPAFTQEVAKETDKLGLTSNATSADIKKLGSEGKITSDILFAAAKNLAAANAPATTASEAIGVALTNLQERIAEAFGPAIITAVETFSAAITAVGNWFKANQQGIEATAKAFLDIGKVVGPIAIGILAVVKAYQAWQLISKAVAATQAFIVALTGPQGIAMVAAAGVAAGVAYAGLNGILKGTEEELKKQKAEAAGASDEFGKVLANAGELPNKNKAAAESAKQLTETYKETAIETAAALRNIDAQIASLERGASINSARYEAEKAFNDLQGQQLERQYELAQTAQQRLNIAIAIFNQQVQAAQIEYKQALENIQLELRKQELQVQSAQLKYQEIEAEGRLQILKADSAAEEAKKKTQLDQALAAQNQVVQAAYDNTSAQQQIAQYQEQAAAAQYESKLLSAQTALEQKLVSDKIGLSQAEAVRLSTGLKDSQASAAQLSGSTDQVAQNALGAAGNFIRVATEADKAATAISNAANQQARLNALQGGGGGGGAPVKQAADGAYWSGGFKAFADGGVVTQPTMGLVGEGGEAEYIIPASKMQAAMERYASGQRGSSVIPTSVNPQVSVTTGPVMNMDGQNYVSQQDFMTGLQTASKRGAEMALQTLGNSYSARRSAGIA